MKKGGGRGEEALHTCSNESGWVSLLISVTHKGFAVGITQISSYLGSRSFGDLLGRIGFFGDSVKKRVG